MVLSILHLRSHFGMRFAPYPSKALGMERSPKPRPKKGYVQHGVFMRVMTFHRTPPTFIYLLFRRKNSSKFDPWQVFVTFLGWLSDPFKWLSDIQLKRSHWITWPIPFKKSSLMSPNKNGSHLSWNFATLTDAFPEKVVRKFSRKKWWWKMAIWIFMGSLKIR